MRTFRRLAADRAGSSAAEMALVMPLLLVLMFGTFELGYYFLSEHVVQKSVRDAARYAARLPLASYPSCTVPADTETLIRNVARTGLPDGTVSRLAGWTNDPTYTTVTVNCTPTGTYTGIYVAFPTGVPVVTVTASVPYPTLFGTIGLGVPSLQLNAASQSAVYGA